MTAEDDQNISGEVEPDPSSNPEDQTQTQDIDTEIDGSDAESTAEEAKQLDTEKHAGKNGISQRDHSVTEIMETGVYHRKGSLAADDTETKSESSQTTDSDIKVKSLQPVGFFSLFRYADAVDKVLMFFGTLGMMGMGCAFPLNLLIYGSVINDLIQDQIRRGNATGGLPGMNATGVTIPPMDGGELFKTISSQAINFVFVGIGVIVVGFIGMCFWIWTAERQIFKIRRLFFNSVMRQSIGWFDQQQVGELTTQLADDIGTIQTGLGDKMATFIQWMTTFLAGFVLGFVQGWKLTLVILAFVPLIVFAGAFLLKTMRTMTLKEVEAYGKAGAIAEEVLSSIRTVAAFTGEEKEVQRYAENLSDARRLGIRKGLASGFGQALIYTVIFSAFGFAFWYGTKLSRDEPQNYSGGKILQVFLGVLIGSMSLGHAAPNLENFSNARGAAAKVYHIIDAESEIDSTSDSGEKPQNCEGNIRLESVEFTYRTRQEVPVLQGLSIDIRVGQTVALVGPSGCGKSTVVQLIQRFYDPNTGRVLVDGTDIRSLNIGWLRDHIGVVSQEPVLFATNIGENIRYGRDGVTQAEIETAAKEANAHDFITQLPDGYDTLVGERGAQLSGGQKQRIAIARALVRNPKILLLDEATSALDNESEAIVQDALDKVSQGRTTVVIAHRLSTIKNANVIIGVRDGKVAESGTHEELMQKGGLYFELVTNQTNKPEKDDDEDLVDDDDINIEDKTTFNRQDSKRWSRGSAKRGSLKRPRYLSTSESQVSEKWTEKDEAELEEKLPEASTKRIMRINAASWPYVLLGCISAIFVGCIHPVFAVVFSSIIGNFAEVDDEQQASNASLYAGLIVAIGLVGSIGQIGQNFAFAISGENITLILRKMAFATMLKQEMGWFDDPKNQVGALTARLATDSSIVRGAAGSQMGLLIQSVANMGVAIIIAFVYGWKLAFVVCGFLPLLIISGLVQGKLLSGFSKQSKGRLEEGAKIASEAIENVRTVASLGKEQTFIGNYDKHFKGIYKSGRKNSFVYGIAFCISQSIIFFCYAAAFTFGAWLIERGEMDFVDVFRVFSAITFGGMALGRATSYAPDYQKAKMAAAKLFSLFDRVPEIDSSAEGGVKLETCDGNLEFSSVEFRYPMRKDVTVLKGLNLEVKQGQTVALVGSSGCGKSTTIQLIERFYDAESGYLKLDGHSTKELNIQWLRRQIGLVSQEPVLFGLSIKENIAYGDTSRDVPMEEIIEAAKQANIHGFIKELPLGYDTHVGEKGAQLSGGQKQRIAIARALVRNPKVLLLDEATSALDTESEKVVQEALDRAREGRTSVVIAHRLSTIQNADQIIVIHNGVVIEAGTHSQLLAAQGQYYKLHSAQHRTKKQTADS